MIEDFIAELCKWLVAFTLLIGAIAKTKTFTNFNHQLIDGLGFKHNISLVLSVLIVLCESVIGLMVVFFSHSSIPFILALVLFIVFTAFLGWAVVNNKRISCNCFGESEQPINKYDLFRNAALIATTVFCLLSQAVGQFAFSVMQIQAAFFACMIFVLLIHIKETVALIQHKSLGNS